jgi:hypothetical protein
MVIIHVGKDGALKFVVKGRKMENLYVPPGLCLTYPPLKEPLFVQKLAGCSRLEMISLSFSMV